MIIAGSVHHSSGQSKYIDSLQHIVTLHHRDSMEIEALLNLTNEFLRKDFDRAKTYAYQALALSNAIKKDFGKNSAYHYLIALHQNAGRTDSCLYYLDQMKVIAIQNPSNWKMEANYNQSAGLFYKNQGEYKKALPFLLANLGIVKSEESRAGLLLNIGNLYHDLGDLKNAAYYHLQSLALFEKIKNKRGQSFCLQSLGNSFLSLNQYAQAKNYYERSIKLKEDLQDKRGIISSSISLGDVYKELNQFKVAENYYTQSLKAAHEMKLLPEEVRCLNQLGLLYKRTGDINRARENMSQSLKLSRQSGDSTISARINSELLGLDLLEKKAREIETTLLSNLNTVINSGDRRNAALEYSRLSEYYALNKKFNKAYDYLRKHEALTDSVAGNMVLLQMNDLEKKYESEKKEQEIILLKKDKELHQLELGRERANVIIIIIVLISVVIIGALLINRYRVTNKAKRILEIERMRNGIARDLHDDIGSTLSSINILSKLALQTNNGESIKYFQRIHEHSGQIMEKMSDIVWSINPNNDSLEQVLVKMKEFAAEILEPKNIAYSFEEAEEVKSLALTIEKRKNIFLIFKEAVNNAAKYSEGSLITIHIWIESEKIQLSISDNGKGFDALTVKPGNGLKNMEARAANIFGTLQRISSPKQGTSIRLEVPIT